ncbi:MAG: hypothetical protein QW275_03090 [Candidatus Anstonellaceae archaeon]
MSGFEKHPYRWKVMLAPEAKSRKLISKGEEASVYLTKFKNPFLSKKVLVERICDVSLSGMRLEEGNAAVEIEKKNPPFQLLQSFFPQSFFLKGTFPSIRFDSFHGQFLFYYSLRLAHTLFPDNFPLVRALRFSSYMHGTFSHIYSDFVPDLNDAIPRKAKIFSQYMKISNPEKQASFKRDADATEHLICPRLKKDVSKIGKAGLILAHPETNYHFTKKGCVFFEINGIDLKKLISYIENIGDSGVKKKAKIYLSLLLATVVDYNMFIFLNQYRQKHLAAHGHEPQELREDAISFFVNNLYGKKEFIRFMLDIADDKGFSTKVRLNPLFSLIKESDYLKGGGFTFLRDYLGNTFLHMHLMKIIQREK